MNRSALIAVLLTLSLAACGEKADETASAPAAPAAAPAAPAAAPAADQPAATSAAPAPAAPADADKK